MVIGTSQDVKNKVLIVNASNESPSSLISKLIGKDNLTFTSIYNDEIQATDWQIDNKYYTADIEFWVLNQHKYPPTQIPLNIEQLGNLCEALILVFDATKKESFEKIHKWSQFVEECNPNVLLCVGIGKSENKSELNEWSVDNGLEYVELAESATQSASEQANPSASASASGEDDDENADPYGGAEGKDRIIEALSSTMWSNMKQKARRLEDQFSSVLNLGDDEEDELEKETTQGAGGLAPTFDPFNFDEDLRLARGEFRHATDEISQNLSALRGFLRENEAGEINGEEDDDQKDDTEENVENFESALSGLRRLRENAQQLPDAQRKALAAHVVSMLFPDEEDWQ